MKIVLDKQTLLDKLSIAGRFSSNKLSSIPSLQGICLESSENTLQIYSTNLNQYYHTSISAKGEGETKIVVEGTKLSEFLNLIPNGPVTLESDEKKITITKDKIKGNFATMVLDDFPPLPQAKDMGVPTQTTIFRQVANVLFSAARDESRPILAAINFVEKEGELLMVSTDGFRLSLARSKTKEKYPPMLIPAAFLTDVSRSVKDSKNVEFAISNSEKIFVIKLGSDTFYTRLIDGEFPPFEKVVPNEHKTHIVVDHEELLRNVKIVSILARDHSNILIFDVVSNGIHIRPKTESGDEGGAFQEAEVKGDPMQVAFNYKFVYEYLNAVNGSQKIIIELLRPDAPVVFRSSEEKDFVHIIMPVRIQS